MFKWKPSTKVKNIAFSKEQKGIHSLYRFSIITVRSQVFLLIKTNTKGIQLNISKLDFEELLDIYHDLLLEIAKQI